MVYILNNPYPLTYYRKRPEIFSDKLYRLVTIPACSIHIWRCLDQFELKSVCAFDRIFKTASDLKGDLRYRENMELKLDDENILMTGCYNLRNFAPLISSSKEVRSGSIINNLSPRAVIKFCKLIAGMLFGVLSVK